MSAARTCRLFVAALNRGDAADAATHLARDGAILTPDGTSVHGREAVRAILAQFVSQQPRIAVGQVAELSGGGVAIARQRWHLELSGGLVRDTDSVHVLRMVESSWKLAITAPWGLGA